MTRAEAQGPRQGRGRPQMAHPRPPWGAHQRVGFLIAGVQKAGTSSLFAMLSRHPQLVTSRPKELHFFDDDDLDWADPDYSSYHQGIGRVNGTLMAGEATPSYIFWPGALERVRAYNPQMLLILCFRDPIARAFSQWCMNKERNDKRQGFGAAVRAVHPHTWPLSVQELGGRGRSYVARGYYGQQLRHALELFSRRQMALLDYHTAFASPSATLDQLTHFLGVERLETAQTAHRRSRGAAFADVFPSVRDIEMLANLYREDLRLFEELSRVDISGWPTAQIIAGSLDPAAYAAQLGGASAKD